MTQTNQKTGKVRTIRRGMGQVEMKGKAFPRAMKLTVKKVPVKKRKLGCTLGVQRPLNSHSLLEKAIILVGIYNQQIQGTIF